MKRMPSSKPEFILCICIFLGLFIVFSSSANATEKKRTLSQNPLVIYDDALSNDWELATNDSRTNESLMHPNIVQSGSYSIQLEVIEDWGTFNLKPKNGALQFNDYKTLRFWIYTDNRIQLKLKDGAGEYTALEVTEFRNDIPLPANEWTLIEVDLSRYSSVGTQFTELRWMGFGDRQPTFYLDQIELIKADSAPLDFPPSDNLGIYYDLLADEWEMAIDDNRTNKDWAESSIVYSGNRSIKLDVVEDWGGFSLKPKNGSVQLSDYKSLRFWIYTTNRIQLKLKDGESPYTTLELTEFRNDIPIPANEWTLIEADLSRYSSDITQFTELLWMGFGDKRPIFYLDQIELIKDNTQEQPIAETIYLSPSSNMWINNVFRSYRDIYAFNPETEEFSLFLDSSDLELNSIDAFQVMSDGSIYFSIHGISDLTSQGVGVVTDHDILKFSPSSLGYDTAGTLELYFDGSDVDLTAGSETIESFSILENGDLIMGSTHQIQAEGVVINSGSLARFTPTSLGETTSGTWSIFLDGTDFIDNSTYFEGISGVYIFEPDSNSTEIFLTYKNEVTIQGLTYPKGSVIKCQALSLGSTTSCESTLFWDTSDAGLLGQSLNGLSLKLAEEVDGPTGTPTPTLTPTAIPSVTQTPIPTPITTPVSNNEYTVSVNNGKIFTRRSEVTVHLTAPDSTTHVKISNDGGFAGSEWQPYSETVVWEIDSFLNFLLPRVVYVRFKDADGSTSSVYSDDIILDVLAPWGSGRAFKDNNKFRLALNADDDVSGIDQFRLSSEDTFPESDWQLFEEDIDIVLGGSQELLFLQLSDKAGNISDPIEVEFLTNSIYLPSVNKNITRK